MKRKITELEKTFIDKGFRLDSKVYRGKKSQSVEFYVYKGTLENYSVALYMDYKRENVHHYVIENKLPYYIGRDNIDALEKVYNEIYDLIYGKYDDYADEVVETLEVVENE